MGRNIFSFAIACALFGCGGGSPFVSPCAALAECCNGLGAAEASCRSQVAAVEQAGGDACVRALEQAQQSGACGAGRDAQVDLDVSVSVDAAPSDSTTPPDAPVPANGVTLEVLAVEEVFSVRAGPVGQGQRAYSLRIRFGNGTSDILPVRNARWSLEVGTGLVHTEVADSDCPSASLAPGNSISCTMIWTIPAADTPRRLYYQSGSYRSSADVPAPAALCQQLSQACTAATCCGGALGTSCRGYQGRSVCCLEGGGACRDERDCCGAMLCTNGRCQRGANAENCEADLDCQPGLVCVRAPPAPLLPPSGRCSVPGTADVGILDAGTLDTSVPTCFLGNNNQLICAAFGCSYCPSGACVANANSC